jgi:hypothetical protein
MLFKILGDLKLLNHAINSYPSAGDPPLPYVEIRNITSPLIYKNYS